MSGFLQVNDDKDHERWIRADAILEVGRHSRGVYLATSEDSYLYTVGNESPLDLVKTILELEA